MRDWDNIRIFLGVCRHGSLAAAARALKVDETTVGRDGRSVTNGFGELDALVPASIHKSQGSEYPAVVISGHDAALRDAPA